MRRRLTLALLGVALLACTLLAGATSPRLKIYNYSKVNTNLLGCSANGTMTIHGSEVSTNNWTRFNLPLSSRSDANIVIKANNC